ncbi:hypothetical protein BDD12DRAFT_880863 [Trichophaea hybrida]|nr:hypothetical protein BDD12DRAFT_880863 [Trichophaea hybrida]
MAYSSADGRRVFLTYRTVFTGPHAQIRKSKKVREVIEQHRGSFKLLIKDFGFDKIADIVKTLLDQRVFESELKAKIAFPELSPARDVQRNESENDAARSAAEAIEELTSASDVKDLAMITRMITFQRAILEPAAKIAPSLYPSYLPYKIQYLILTIAQRQLEETLAKRCDKVPTSAVDNGSEAPLKEVFFSTNVLRHTAVHRLPTTARGIHKMIQSASRLAQTLGDHSRAAELENPHLEIGSRIRDMELNKNFLENRLDEQLQAISEQRAELDRKEREAIATMLQKDQENKLLIGSFLEDAVNITFGRPDEIGPVESTNMVNDAHESDVSDGDEHENVGAGLL